nr:PQ-loop domain-containing transporter [Tessaracoccus sp. ZS01]
MADVIEVFGWFAAALGVSSSIPQLVRILRSGTSAGVSLTLWQLVTGSTAAWAVHGFLSQSPQMQVPNVLLTVASLAIVVFVLRDRGEPVARHLVLPVVAALALSGLNLWLGPVFFGFAVLVPQLVGQFAQLRELLTAPHVEGVSGSYLVLMLLVQAMWFGFGMFKPDWALIICAGAMTLSCVANLAVYLVRRARAGRTADVVAAS